VRGLNVGGANLIKMDRLRDLLSKLGFTEIRTYIQSGNIVFTSKKTAAACGAAIERSLARELEKPIGVTIRTAPELAKIIAKNPFAKEKDAVGSRVAIVFSNETPKKANVKTLEAMDFGRDRWAVSGKETYLYCPDGFGRSKLAVALERVLGIRATSRNLNTVRKLLELATL
jgi:uncharacterized protein (DUF1697 family)